MIIPLTVFARARARTGRGDWREPLDRAGAMADGTGELQRLARSPRRAARSPGLAGDEAGARAEAERAARALAHDDCPWRRGAIADLADPRRPGRARAAVRVGGRRALGGGGGGVGPAGQPVRAGAGAGPQRRAGRADRGGAGLRRARRGRVGGAGARVAAGPGLGLAARAAGQHGQPPARADRPGGGGAGRWSPRGCPTRPSPPGWCCPGARSSTTSPRSWPSSAWSPARKRPARPAPASSAAGQSRRPRRRPGRLRPPAAAAVRPAGGARRLPPGRLVAAGRPPRAARGARLPARVGRFPRGCSLHPSAHLRAGGKRRPSDLREGRSGQDGRVRGAFPVEVVRAAERAAMQAVPDGALMQRAAAGLAAECARILRRGVYGTPGRAPRRRRRQRRRRALRRGAAGRAAGAAVTAVLLSPDRAHPGGLAALRAAGGRALPAGSPAATDVAGRGPAGAGRDRRDRRLAAGCGRARGRAASRAVTGTRRRGRPAQRRRRGHRRGRGRGGPGRRDRHLRRAQARAAGRRRRRARRRRARWSRSASTCPEPPAAGARPGRRRPGCCPGPGPRDDKYTRGVVGVAAGSATYPGAGVLVGPAGRGRRPGMVRYAGGAAEHVRPAGPRRSSPRASRARPAGCRPGSCGPGIGTDDARRPSCCATCWPGRAGARRRRRR